MIFLLPAAVVLGPRMFELRVATDDGLELVSRSDSDLLLSWISSPSPSRSEVVLSVAAKTTFLCVFEPSVILSVTLYEDGESKSMRLSRWRGGRLRVRPISSLSRAMTTRIKGRGTKDLLNVTGGLTVALEAYAHARWRLENGALGTCIFQRILPLLHPGACDQSTWRPGTHDMGQKCKIVHTAMAHTSPITPSQNATQHLPNPPH